MDRKLLAAQLITNLKKRGISLWEENGKIRYKTYSGVFNSQDKEDVKKYKSEILEFLRDSLENIEVIEDLENRFKLFELTDVQQAYLLGRNNLFEYGDVACHIYLQLKYKDLQLEKVQQIWNILIQRHEMLKAVIYENGYQEILQESPVFLVKDFGNKPAEEVMKEIGHTKYAIGKWPYFSVGISKENENFFMHFSIEFIIADWTSIWILLKEFEQLYFNDDVLLPDIHLSYRDYVKAEVNMRDSLKYEEDRAYWWNRIDTFAEAPKLPVEKYNNKGIVHFNRKYKKLSSYEWNKIKKLANKNSLTPTILVLMAYAATLERFSENKNITLNLTVLNRMPIHEDINKIVGDFTSINLLEVNFQDKDNFLEIAKETNERMFEDLDHRLYSGIEVMREISRRKGRETAFMPYVFTSAIGLLNSIGSGAIKGLTSVGISQTPQVFIDCQVMDGDFGMQVNWDIREGVFDEKLIDDMFECFIRILENYIKEENLNKILPIALPKRHQEIIRQSNNTKKSLPSHLLHEKIINMALMYPERTAIISENKEITYKELMKNAIAIYKELLKLGCTEQEAVIIYMEKSFYQVAAALAILAAKAVYVPVSPRQGEERTANIIKQTGAKIIITNIDSTANTFSDKEIIFANRLKNIESNTEILPCDGYEKQLAYIIFTSGSTGEPKGVSITHEAVVNTIEDINDRYHIGGKDIILGISELNFDLSVYDIFGILSQGGVLVYPEENRKKDPAYLYELIKKYKITLWNSVPALLQMLLTYMESIEKVEIDTLRTVFLSGDWIPLELPDAFLRYIPNAEIVSMGGATEVSIWSIYHNYKGISKEFKSIPYGKPLANQEFRVLDSKLQDCPIGIKGELYITGKGLAQEYYKDIAKTKEQFITHPYENIRMYKTGDYGKYHYNGEIEFLGRKDNQIKINGHRIELGEVEAAVKKVPGVANNVVLCERIKNEKHLFCYYETEYRNLKNISNQEEFLNITEGINSKARGLVQNVDKKVLIRALKVRDEAILSSMLVAIINIIETEEFDSKEILDKERVIEKYKWLILYWLKLLERRNYIQKDEKEVYKIDTQRYKELTFDKIKLLWKKVKAEWLPEMGSELFYEYLYQNATNLKELLCGEMDPIKILYPDGKKDIVNEMYSNNTISKYLNSCICEFVQRYSENHKNIKILEIGAGTCATSRQIINILKGKSYQYCISDINKFFLPAARKEFEKNNNVEVALLDIDGDIYEQGFRENQYDLIIAVGVLENVKNIRKSLNIIKQLIAPGGYFLFTEPVVEEAWILSSQGFLMTKPEDELRKDNAIIDGHKWMELLEELDSKGKIQVFPEEWEPIKNTGLELFIKQLKIDKENVKPTDVKEIIQKFLPSYMIPTQYHFMDKIPLNSNGKLDRKRLHALAKINNNLNNIKQNNKELMTEQQKVILETFESLGVNIRGLNDNFYEFGADSLIMAQATGKLRKNIAQGIPFDTLLRYLLNYPTIKQVAEFLDKSKNKDVVRAITNNIGSAQFYDAGQGPLRVVFHAAFGTMNSQKYLVEFLIKQKKGKIMTIALGKPEVFYRMNKESAVEELAEDYLKLILETGCTKVQLIGYCFGGWLATTIGNRLQERGIEIVDLAMIDCQTVPWIIEDDLLLEMMFVPNFGIKYAQLGLENEKIVELLFFKIIEKYGFIPENGMLKDEFRTEFGEAQEVFLKLNSMKMKERFELYSQLAYESTGEVIEYEMLRGLFMSFAQTTRAVHCEMQPYIGNIRYFSAREFSNMFFDSEKDIEYWKEICLGEFNHMEIEGNHFTCVEIERNAKKLAEELGNF